MRKLEQIEKRTIHSCITIHYIRTNFINCVNSVS